MCDLQMPLTISAWTEGDRDGTKRREGCWTSGLPRVLYEPILLT